jgi:1-acyl-sn-glycerol-3-phosphate acyltransferase
VSYRLTKVLAGPFLHLLWRPRVSGVEHVPATGGAIIASNHLSVLDTVLMPLVVPRPVTFVAKSESFTGTGLVDRLTSRLLRGAGQLSVDRTDRRAAQQALEASLGVLEAGDLFGIYPEGTRSPDGRLYRGHTGVGWLAVRAGVPVVPVAMHGTDQAMPPGRAVPRPMRIEVRFGPALSFERYAGQAGSARARRAVTDEVMAAIQALSGQTVVPAYAPARESPTAGRAR